MSLSEVFESMIVRASPMLMFILPFAQPHNHHENNSIKSD